MCHLLAFCNEAWEGLGKQSIENKREITLMSIGVIQHVTHHINLAVTMGLNLETKPPPP